LLECFESALFLHTGIIVCALHAPQVKQLQQQLQEQKQQLTDEAVAARRDLVDITSKLPAALQDKGEVAEQLAAMKTSLAAQMQQQQQEKVGVICRFGRPSNLLVTTSRPLFTQALQGSAGSRTPTTTPPPETRPSYWEGSLDALD
jgi:uncharacterized Zn finger protein (UPF0148 family)